MNKELERIANSIANYDSKARKCDISKEQLVRDFGRMVEVYESLRVPEMKLLWFLRHSGFPEMIYGLLDNAEKSYEALQTVIAYRNEMNRISSGKM